MGFGAGDVMARFLLNAGWQLEAGGGKDIIY